ncbi:MAG: dolichyl-phosphate beta-glucosyltransferase [Patescibacteria group bacterium]
MEKKIELSVIIPAYNEAGRITETLQQTWRYLSNQPYFSEIIVVDDGCTDTTIDVVQGHFYQIPNLRLIRHRYNQGKGQAVKTGVNSARGRWILFMDADLATPISELDKLWSQKNNYDVLIGSRHLQPKSIKTPQPWYRFLFGRAGNFLIRSLLLANISDTQCGFKLFSHKAAHDLFNRLTINGFGFDIEILVLAQILEYQIAEISVDWYDKPHGSVNIWRDGWRVFSEVLRIKYRISQSLWNKSGYTQKIF